MGHSEMSSTLVVMEEDPGLTARAFVQQTVTPAVCRGLLWLPGGVKPGCAPHGASLLVSRTDKSICQHRPQSQVLQMAARWSVQGGSSRLMGQGLGLAV